MGKIFSINDIREILNDISKKAGLDCSDVPIRISSKMKKTYGCFRYKNSRGKMVDKEFVFALKLISGDYEDKVVKDTIEHEYIHYLTESLDGFNHKHDIFFKRNCLKYGVNPSTYFTGHHNEELKQGYKLYCSKCGREVGRRRRIDAANNIVKNYRSNCCSSIIRKEASYF